jgi:SHS2 domain-containing protein
MKGIKNQSLTRILMSFVEKGADVNIIAYGESNCSCQQVVYHLYQLNPPSGQQHLNWEHHGETKNSLLYYWLTEQIPIFEVRKCFNFDREALELLSQAQTARH